MTDRLRAIALLLTGWLDHLPADVRRRVYKGFKVVASVLTLAILVLPLLPEFGIDLPTPARWLALVTAALAFVSTLADHHTPVTPPAGVQEDFE